MTDQTDKKTHTEIAGHQYLWNYWFYINEKDLFHSLHESDTEIYRICYRNGNIILGFMIPVTIILLIIFFWKIIPNRGKSHTLPSYGLNGLPLTSSFI